MDNHRRNSIIENPPTANYGDTRSSYNTTATLPKPQVRAPEFSPRHPRPEFYQQQQQQQQQQPQQLQQKPLQQQQQQQLQGTFGSPNRPPSAGQQLQQRQPPPMSRSPGDKASPWNLVRQTALPANATIRGPLQQRPPYFNMQPRPPSSPSAQGQEQQYRPQPPMSMQDRRPMLTRIEDRSTPFRPENGRPARPAGNGGGGVSGVGGGGDDDDEVVVVNSNQQPPPLNRRDSVVYAARPAAEGDPNRQWQRPVAGPQGTAPYGKPPEQLYSRQTTTIQEGQEQRYAPPSTAYNRQPEDEPRRPMANGGQNARDAQPLTRRDSVLQDGFKTAAGKNDADEYGRRPVPSSDLQEENNRRPSDYGAGGRRLVTSEPEENKQPLEYGGGGRRPVDQEENKRAFEYRKLAVEPEDTVSRVPDFKNNRPEVNADYGNFRVKPTESRADFRDQERKGSAEKPQEHIKMEHGNRASELRKSYFEATYLKAAKEQPYSSKVVDNKGLGGRGPRNVDDAMTKFKDYTTVARSNDNDSINKDRNRLIVDDGRNDDQYSKNSRPDTLNLLQDNDPLKDSSNSKGNYRNDDVGKSPSKIPKKDQSELKTPTRVITPKTPDSVMSAGQKKLPMNKIQVGSAPSPNLKVVRSKIGSLQNTSHKPGGGQVKIENRKLEWKAGTRIEAKNDAYVPGGGDKKIQSVKLQWNAKPKVGSLENKTHKPGGGDKKIETVKLDFKDKAKPKIGSKDNIKHTPGGGAVKIEDQKLEIKAQSKIGSLDNVKHKPGGGEVKIFDDKSYIKQTTGQIGTPTKSQLRRSSSLKSPTNMKFFSPDERPKSHVKIVVTPTSEEDLYTKIGTDTDKGGPRRLGNSRSPSLQSSNIVIPEEAVRSKK